MCPRPTTKGLASGRGTGLRELDRDLPGVFAGRWNQPEQRPVEGIKGGDDPVETGEVPEWHRDQAGEMKEAGPNGPEALLGGQQIPISNGCSSGVRSSGVRLRNRLISGLWPKGSTKIADPDGLKTRLSSR